MSNIILRGTKGIALSYAELDANFTSLNTAKLELGQAQASGTANGVAYLNGSKVLTTGSALTFDGTKLDVQASGYPIINVASTSGSGGNGATFQAKNGGGASSFFGTEATSGSYSYTGAIANAAYAGSSGASPLQLITDSVARATLDTSGNLGLGVTPSAWSGAGVKAMQIASAGAISASGGSTSIAYNAYYDGTNSRYLVSQPAFLYTQQFNLGHAWYNAASGTAGNPITFTQAMTLDASGNLGVGTTSPASFGRLSVVGNIASVSPDATIQGIYSAANTGEIRRGGFKSGGNTFLVFTTGADTERARIDSNGNLLVGTTSSDTAATKLVIEKSDGTTASTGAYLVIKNQNVGQSTHGAQTPAGGILFSTYRDVRNPSYTAGITCTAVGRNGTNTGAKLSFRVSPEAGGNFAVDGNAALPPEVGCFDSHGRFMVGTQSPLGGLGAKVNIDSGGDRGIVQNITSTASSGRYQEYLYSGLTVGHISTNGTSTTYATSSDYRLKTAIGPVTDSGKRIDALQPVEYTWKADGSRTRGFLAHEFQEVYAGSVTGAKDAVDDEGKPVYQGMQAGSSEVIADLVAEIQSLRKRLAAAGI